MNSGVTSLNDHLNIMYNVITNTCHIFYIHLENRSKVVQPHLTDESNFANAEQISSLILVLDRTAPLVLLRPSRN